MAVVHFANYASVLVEMKEFGAATSSQAESVKLAKELLQSAPDDLAQIRQLAIGCEELGDMHQKIGQAVAARSDYKMAYELVQKLRAQDDEGTDEWSASLLEKLARPRAR